MLASYLIGLISLVTIVSASVLHGPGAFAPGFSPAFAPAITPAFAPAFAPAIAPAFAPAFASGFAPFAFAPPPVSFGLAPPVFKPHVSFAVPAVYKPHYHLGFANPLLKTHFTPVLKHVPFSVHYHKTVIPPAAHFKSFGHYAPSFSHSHFL